MYEIEKKFEISPNELQNVIERMHDIGYNLTNVIEITDYYPIFFESQIKPNSFDFERYRLKDSSKIIKTIKRWVKVDGIFQREENESEFFGDIPASTHIINKYRQVYTIENKTMPEIVIDVLNFGDAIKYYIEAELATENKDELEDYENTVYSALEKVLDKDLKNIPQAPSMLHLIINNLSK
jgi:hypothetical protein